MDRGVLIFWLTVIGVVCWPICFIWMYRLSARQQAMLNEIHAQGRRIEDLARLEHNLLREVHPQVGEIKEELAAVADSVKDLPQPG